MRYAMRPDLQAGKKNTRWVLLGNGDVPLDEVASFTTGLTISIEFFTWHFLRDFKGRKIALSRDVKMVRFKCTRIFVLTVPHVKVSNAPKCF